MKINLSPFYAVALLGLAYAPAACASYGNMRLEGLMLSWGRT